MMSGDRRTYTRRRFLAGAGTLAVGAAASIAQAAPARLEKKYGMVVDLDKCVACQACTISCKIENNLPEGVFWNRVVTQTEGKFPNVRMDFIPQPCMHCERPPCVNACPVSARFKRDDGLVLVNYNRCIGCKYCITACPYGVNYVTDRKFVHEAYGDAARDVADSVGVTRKRGDAPGTGLPYHNPRVTVPPRGVVTKCSFCHHRLDANNPMPACVEACPSGARLFGDLNDPGDPVGQLALSARSGTLRPEQKTSPQVYYLR